MNKCVLTEPWTLYFQCCEIIQIVLFCWMTIIFLRTLIKRIMVFVGKGDASKVYRPDVRFPVKLGFLALLVGVCKTLYLIQYDVPLALLSSTHKYEFRTLFALIDTLFPLELGMGLLLVGYVETLILEYIMKKKD